MQHRIEAAHSATGGEILEAAGNADDQGEPVADQVPRLPGIAAQLIGERIRAMYTRLIEEPVPERLRMLIRELEQKERPK